MYNSNAFQAKAGKAGKVLQAGQYNLKNLTILSGGFFVPSLFLYTRCNDKVIIFYTK